MKLSNEILIHDDGEITFAFKLSNDECIYRFHGAAGEIVKDLSVQALSEDELIAKALNLVEGSDEEEASEFIKKLLADLKECDFLEG